MNTHGIRTEFIGKIAFRPSAGKLASCLRFMMAASSPVRAAEDPGLGLALLLAEQSHLCDWGRPVTGCEYVLKDGVPSPVTIAEATKRVASEAVVGIPDVIDDIHGNLEVVFSNLSRSDMECMQQALRVVAEDRTAAIAKAAGFFHGERADYALMVEDDDPERLRRKLEDLAGWGRYFHLGR